MPTIPTLTIIDLPDAAQVQIRLTDADGNSENLPPAAFTLPLAADEWAALDWYYRAYPQNPIGALPRAEATETALRNLGRLLYESLFPADSLARAGLHRLIEQDTRPELAIVSARPEFLALPWELLNEPDLGYFAAVWPGILRQSTLDLMPAIDEPRTDESLNVLLLSPAPGDPIAGNPTAGDILLPNAADANAVSGGSLADAAVAALESLNAPASLDHPRPATWNSLRQQLERTPNYYHLVHLDGITIDANGAILLETDAGAPDPIAPDTIGAALAAAGVNIALISAGAAPDNAAAPAWCQMAQAIANAGVAQVAILPYALHPDAAGPALRAFYTALARGNPPAASIAALRRSLMDTPERITLHGKRIVWDWPGPAVVQSRPYIPPTIAEPQPDPLAAPVINPVEAPTDDLQIPAAGQYGLVGRQTELRELERRLSTNAIVLLSADAGAGKTELALGLCRWFLKPARSRYPGGVFYTAFEASHPAGLERVVHEIGTAVAGLDFADLPAEQQRRWVTAYLQENPSLLVWDNGENVAGFPDGAPGLLSDSELPQLAAFLDAVTVGPAGSRALLLTRRPDEPWLTMPHAAVVLNPLAGPDRIALAANIMNQAAIPASRVDADFAALLELLAGHPLAMQVVLPILKELPAASISAELRRRLDESTANTDADANANEPGRSPILTAAMAYAFTRMPHRSRTHLPFLALFQRRVMLDILSHITEERIYGQVMGGDLASGASRSLLAADGGMQSSGRSYSACRALLRTAQAAGFLEPVSPSVYQINPALPWFLGRQLSRQVSGAGIRQLEQEFVRVYADTADYFMESLYENQDTGVTAVLAEEGNLTQALGLAAEYRQWDNAQILMQPLAQVYRMQKRFPELRRRRAQLLDIIGHTAADATANDAIDFWQYLLGTDAMESVELLELDRAAGFNQQLLDYLLEQPDGAADPRTAAVYHQNGLIATRRGQYDTASEWLEKGLEIIDGGDDQESIADACFAIGQVRHHQRQYGAAKEWYRRALDIHQRLPDYEEMVNDCRALGAACHFRFEFDEARSWYHRAREMVEENRDEETAVHIFHALGTVDHSEYLFEDAQSWYQQALGLSDRLGMTDQMIVEFHHLGTLAQARGIPDEAEEWLTVALERREEMGDWRGAGDEARQIGVLHHEQGNLAQAEQWYDRARQHFEECRDVSRCARTYGQLGVVAEEQGNLPDALEWVARTHRIAADYNLPVMPQVKAHLARLQEKMGAATYTQWWRDNIGADPPPSDPEPDNSEPAPASDAAEPAS